MNYPATKRPSQRLSDPLGRNDEVTFYGALTQVEP